MKVKLEVLAYLQRRMLIVLKTGLQLKRFNALAIRQWTKSWMQTELPYQRLLIQQI